MSGEFTDYLEAAASYFQGLKDSGVKHVPLSPELERLFSGRPVAAKAATGPTVKPAAVTIPSAASKPAVIPAATPPASSAAVASGAPLTGPPKIAAMEELRERAMICQKCPNLAGSRQNVVFGVGSIDAELMFVGEAPGADEDVQGEPFVGRAGQLLTRIIQTMGLSREQVYIANILKCRPDTPGQAAGNRKPKPEEMATCLPYLQAQIDLIRPKILVALGGTAVEGLLGASEGITRLRGRFQTYRGIPLMPTYHPSFLLRPNPRNVKREVWEDMLQVMEKLGLPISEKQRGYFLNG